MPDRVRVQICRVVVEAARLARLCCTSGPAEPPSLLMQGEFCRGGNIDLGTVETEAVESTNPKAAIKKPVKLHRGDLQEHGGGGAHASRFLG